MASSPDYQTRPTQRSCFEPFVRRSADVHSSQRRPKRLTFQRDPPRLKGYAHLYRFGRSDAPRPLLIYVGGSTSPSKYLARWSTEPTPIIAEFEVALKAEPLRPLDVLVCPCPMDTRGEGLDGFVDHFEDELLPEVGARPSALACLGYSAGASYAMHLAIVEEARAIVSIGGTGVLEAAEHNRPILDRLIRDGESGPVVALFRNHGDQTVALESLGRNMPRPLQVVATLSGTRGHEFRYYAGNGSLVAGFRFLLECLS